MINKAKDRFSRQICLEEVGTEGQDKLSAASVVVVGAGGLGCPLIQYLAAAGLGSLTIIDGDKVELSNLHRQVIYNEADLGRSKALLASKVASSLYSGCKVETVCQFINTKNVKQLLAGSSLIIDGTDNFYAKYLLNDASSELGIPLLTASIERFSLQLAMFNLKGSASLRCLFPEPPRESLSCSEAGVLGPVAGVAGCLQATEAIKYLTAPESYQANFLIVLDLKKMDCQKLKISANLKTLKETTIKEEDHYNNMNSNCQKPARDYEISARELKNLIDSNKDLVLIDVRSEEEHQNFNIGGRLIPAEKLLDNPDLLPKAEQVVLYCQKGIRSAIVLEKLQAKLPDTRFLSLAGGVLEFSSADSKI